MWYCCDGSYCDDRYPVIYSANENDKPDEVLNLINDIGFSPSFHSGGGGVIQFPMSDVDEFFKYIGDHPPGFKYKWPEDFK